MTNYQYGSNNPTSKIDLDGLEGVFLEATTFVPESIPTEAPIENLVKAGGEVNGEPIPQEVAAKIEWHHLIPQALKGTVELVKQAIKEGFGFDSEENLEPVEKFSKATGKGVHGSHPKYTNGTGGINDQLETAAKLNPGSSASDIVRGVANNARQTIRNNPGVKINDLFNMFWLIPTQQVPVKKTNVTVGPLSPGVIVPPPAPKPVPKPAPKPKPNYTPNDFT